MTEHEYRAHPAISRSELWRIRKSPEKFKYYRDNPPEPTLALVFGQLFHKMALLPDGVWDEFAVVPNVDRRTKDGKAEYASFLEDAAGKTIVTVDVAQKAADMCTALHSNGYCRKLLSGAKETPYFWTDELTGEQCKCRTDCTVELGGMPLVVDLKSTNDASTEAFMKAAVTDPNNPGKKSSLGYDVQAAMYLDGVKAVTGRDHKFVFIAIEKDPPYSINILECDKGFLTNGYDIFRRFIGEYHYCKTTGNWYGHMGRDGIINTLSLPAWIAREVE